MELPVIETIADAYAALTACAEGETDPSNFWYVKKRALALGVSPDAITAAGPRIVRTPEGADWFNQPIGSVIVDKSFLKGPKKLLRDIKVGDIIAGAKQGHRIKITQRGRLSAHGNLKVTGVNSKTAELETITLRGNKTGNWENTKVQTFEEVTGKGVKAKLTGDDHSGGDPTEGAPQRNLPTSKKPQYDADGKISVLSELQAKVVQREVEENLPSRDEPTPKMMKSMIKMFRKRNYSDSLIKNILGDSVDNIDKYMISSENDRMKASREALDAIGAKYNSNLQMYEVPKDSDSDLAGWSFGAMHLNDGETTHAGSVMAYPPGEGMWSNGGKKKRYDSAAEAIEASRESRFEAKGPEGNLMVLNDGTRSGDELFGVKARYRDDLEKEMTGAEDLAPADLKIGDVIPGQNEAESTLSNQASWEGVKVNGPVYRKNVLGATLWYAPVEAADGSTWDQNLTYIVKTLPAKNETFNAPEPSQRTPDWAPDKEDWPKPESTGSQKTTVRPSEYPGWFVHTDHESMAPDETFEYYQRPDGYTIAESSGGGGGYYLANKGNEFVAKLGDGKIHDIGDAVAAADSVLRGKSVEANYRLDMQAGVRNDKKELKDTDFGRTFRWNDMLERTDAIEEAVVGGRVDELRSAIQDYLKDLRKWGKEFGMFDRLNFWEDQLAIVNDPYNWSGGPLRASGSALLARAFSEEQRKELAESGAAMKDGSFPVANISDLKNAIHAIGRAKNIPKAKKHIKKRAKALGATDMLPEGW